MRWNVVIGGQLFSKSLRGVMSYKMEFAGLEGWFMGAVLLLLPFAILIVLIKLFLSEDLPASGHNGPGQAGTDAIFGPGQTGRGHGIPVPAGPGPKN
jgi:hypothetical protein